MQTQQTPESMLVSTSTAVGNLTATATATPSPLPTERAAAKVTTGIPSSSTPAPSLTPTSVPPTPTPTRRVPEAPPNIVLIIVDALRSDHVSSYGYQRETTPNLDRLMAEKGVRFTDATSTAPWTCPANAAIMTGRLPSSIGVSWQTMGNSVPWRENTLAELLHKAGYYTAGFANTYCLKGKLGFAQGFDIYDDSLSNHTAADKAHAEMVNARVMSWFDGRAADLESSGKPLFLFIYYFDPHGWYNPLPPYDTLFDAGYTGGLTPDVYRDGQVVVSGEFVPTERDLEHLIAMYDGEIAYWDTYFSEMMAYLEAMGVLENAIVVVTADHGELFGEHNTWAHGSNLYEEVLRVPLLVSYNGVLYDNQVITSPVQSMDVMPTLLEFAGIAVPNDLDAVSLRSQLMGGENNPGRTVFSEVSALNNKNSVLYWTAPRFAMQAVRHDGWKLITQKNRPEEDALYFLQQNSLYEDENVLLKYNEKAEELRALSR